MLLTCVNFMIATDLLKRNNTLRFTNEMDVIQSSCILLKDELRLMIVSNCDIQTVVGFPLYDFVCDSVCFYILGLIAGYLFFMFFNYIS